MLAPLQDGHSQVQLDSQLKFQKKGAEPKLLLSNTFLATLVPTVLKAEKVLVMKDDWSCTAASSPPTSAYSLPTPPTSPHSPCLCLQSRLVMSLKFCSLLSLHYLQARGKKKNNSGTQCQCEDLDALKQRRRK